jgi:DNA-binding beta-propeller fold protein YncE
MRAVAGSWHAGSNATDKLTTGDLPGTGAGMQSREAEGRRAARRRVRGGAVVLALVLASVVAPVAARAGETASPRCGVEPTTTGWCGDGGAAVAARLASPGSLVALPDGGFAFADTLNDAVREVTARGVISTLARLGGVGGCAPAQLALAPDGRLLVAAPDCARVFAIAPDGSVATLAGGVGGPLVAPSGVAVTADGVVLIADGGRLLRLAPGGTLHRIALRPAISPTSLLATADGRVLASDETAGTIWALDLRRGRARVALGHPTVRTTASGAVLARYDPEVGMPSALAAAPDGGLLFADSLGARVRLADLGTIRTIAGSGIPGLAGDRGPALLARLHDPAGIAVRGDGSVLIADAGNDRIRQVVPFTGTIATVAGGGLGLPQPAVSQPEPEGGGPAGSGEPIAGGRPVYPPLQFFALLGPRSVRHGRPLVVQLLCARASAVVVVVRRGGRAVRRVRTRVGGGYGGVRVGGLPAGSYFVEAFALGGGRAHDRRTLLVR